jgi:hypothetical protein
MGYPVPRAAPPRGVGRNLFAGKDTFAPNEGKKNASDGIIRLQENCKLPWPHSMPRDGESCGGDSSLFDSKQTDFCIQRMHSIQIDSTHTERVPSPAHVSTETRKLER